MLPLYEAVRVWLPTPSELTWRVAWPLLRFAVPMLVTPSKKVTVPVGMPTPGEMALTVAENVTV